MDATTPTNASSKLPPLTHSLTPLTHLLVQPCPIHLLGVPPGPGNKQDRGHTGRQSDRQKEKKKEEGHLLCWHRALLCTSYICSSNLLAL